MYSGKFPCSLIINTCKKKRFSGTTDYSVHIRTQIILIRCTSLLAPKIMPLLQSWTVISLCDLFWYDLSSLPKVTGYNLYWICTRWPWDWQVTPNKPGILFWNNITFCTSTYARVCVISANLAQNRLRLIHDVDLYMSIYGSYIYYCQFWLILWNHYDMQSEINLHWNLAEIFSSTWFL